MSDGATPQPPAWRQTMDQAIDRFDIPAIHAMNIPREALQADPAWAEEAARRLCLARLKTQADASLIPGVLDLLAMDDKGQVQMPVYRLMWNTGQVARMLVETHDLACMAWAKRAHLPLEYDGVIALLDLLVPQMATVDLFEPRGWLVRRQNAAALAGGMIAMALFRGEAPETLGELTRHYETVDTDDIAQGVAIFLRRWQEATKKGHQIELVPQIASLAWLGRKCSPESLRQGAKNADIPVLIEPWIRHIQAAPAQLLAQSMEEQTAPAAGQRMGPRL